MVVLAAGAWNRVITPLMPWMTAANAFQCQPEAFQRTMRLDRFKRVLGAAGSITAVVPEQRAQQVAIGVNQY